MKTLQERAEQAEAEVERLRKALGSRGRIATLLFEASQQQPDLGPDLSCDWDAERWAERTLRGALEIAKAIAELAPDEDPENLTGDPECGDGWDAAVGLAYHLAEQRDEAQDEVDRLCAEVEAAKAETKHVRAHLTETIWLFAEMFGAQRDCPSCQKAIRKWDERELGGACLAHFAPDKRMVDHLRQQHEAEVGRLRGALEFYGGRKNHWAQRGDNASAVDRDAGRRARAALVEKGADSDGEPTEGDEP